MAAAALRGVALAARRVGAAGVVRRTAVTDAVWRLGRLNHIAIAVPDLGE